MCLVSDEMKKPWLFLALFAGYSNHSMKAQTSTLLLDYNGKNYTLAKANGKYELTGDDGRIAGGYNLVLPALQPEFSFIVKNGLIGLFDNVAQKEVIFARDYPALELYPLNESEYCLYFLTNTGYGLQMKESFVLTRNADNTITINSPATEDPSVPEIGFYRNGIEKIDDTHYTHHFSHVSWGKDYGPQWGEHEVKFKLEHGIQKSGVFSTTENKFVVPNSFAEIEVPRFDIENPLSAQYIRVAQVTGTDDLEGDWSLSGDELKDPVERFRYGFYSPSYNLVIYPQPAQLYPIINGGFYKTRGSDNEPLELYQADGQELLTVENFTYNVTTIIQASEKVYVGTMGDQMNMEEMQVYHYFVYNKDGKLEKEVDFRFHDRLRNSLVLAAVCKSPESYDLSYGVFDLENAVFAVPPKYEQITIWYFEDGIMDCPTGGCHFYFTCSTESGTVFLDQAFNEFEPTFPVKANFYSLAEENNDEPWGEFAPYELTLADKEDSQVATFANSKLSVKWKVTGPLPASEKNYFGIVADKHKQLNIIAVYADPSDSPLFGLAYDNESSFILPPVFSRLSFDEKKLKLELELKGEKGSILLERYFYDE
ncbi:hypothetical protein RT717_10130 [Imperialibacter roseus]|uniref:Uncharacterized protein n=1 Tax=Imperialibacter roseus TaxID=1324217 RepID=A0ABZ0IZ78_9BACT|nr:hypothetical protein [Imperialibacter roseus]WOK08991.1 hypothetical protein RT717_10130 [Imperialibacter roseus]